MSFENTLSALKTIIAPKQVFEIRILGVSVGHGRTRDAYGYFNDPEVAAEEYWRFIGDAGGGVACDYKGSYFTPNALKEACIARSPHKISFQERSEPMSGDSDVLRRKWLLVDLDPKRPSGVSASDEELERAKAAGRILYKELNDFGLPIVGLSGNGLHLMYPINMDPSDNDTIKLCLLGMQKILLDRGITDVDVDQKVFNPARIWKLPGTESRKGHELPEQRRTYREARLLSVPEECSWDTKLGCREVHEEAIKRFASRYKSESVVVSQQTQTSQQQPKQPWRETIVLREWLSSHGISVFSSKPWNGGEMFILDQCPWNSQHTNKSAFVFQGADGRIRAGCQHNSCEGKNWFELQDVFDPGWRDAAKLDITFNRQLSLDRQRKEIAQMYRDEFLFFKEWVRFNNLVGHDRY